VAVDSRERSHNRLPNVAIIVPLSRRSVLLPEEEISVRHLCHYLPGYDKYLVAAAGDAVRHDGFRVVTFPRVFFGSVAAHNRLLLSPSFYRAFRRYEYILIHHLDSLVLSNQLRRWCEAGWDYIGAPWLPCADTPWVREPRVGNGGFTLMRVQSAIQVLYRRYRSRPSLYAADVILRHTRQSGWLLKGLERFHRVLPLPMVARFLEYRDKTDNPASNGYNSDFFWSFDAARYVPTFKVAPVAEGLQFAFEAAPRMCFELNHKRLPFGCHAWTKFDRAFWEPYLLPPAERNSSARWASASAG
jgi:hypothetical protein